MSPTYPNYPINPAGIALLKEFEQFARTQPGRPDLAHAYWDDLGKVWTIGWGFTKGVKEGDTMPRHVADARLALELDREYVQPILRACTVPPEPNQLAAMACLAWNIGIGWNPDGPKPKGARDGFRQSSALRAHNRGDFDAAARAFALWNKSGGQVVRGLTRRRAAESALYLAPAARAVPAAMPQRVDAESSLARSPIIGGTSLAAGTSTLAIAAESAKSLSDIRDSLGSWLPYVAVALVIALAVYVIHTRISQRRGGWA